MATEKRLKGIPYKCDNCIHIAACQRACIIFAYPFLDYVIRSQSCTAYEPKSDDVEVIRCKDCKHTRKKNGHEQFMYNENVCICTKEDIWGITKDEPVWEDGFCSFGERKDNG